MTFFRFSDKRIIRVTQICAWTFVLVIVAIGVLRRYAPSGVMEVSYTAQNGSDFITNFAAKEADTIYGLADDNSNQKVYRLITASPVYFDVKTPREFSTATVTVQYQNPDDQTSILLGAEQADGTYYYRTLAIELPQLDNLPDYWIPMRVGNVVLWQKDEAFYEDMTQREDVYTRKKGYLDTHLASEMAAIDRAIADTSDEVSRQELEDEKIAKQEAYDAELQDIELDRKSSILPTASYDSIDSFLADPPPATSIVKYDFNLSPYIERPGYQKRTTTQTFNKALRGKHEIYTYIGDDEDLNFYFTIQDINRHPGADPFVVEVYDGADTLIDTVTVPDDGVTEANGEVRPEQEAHILLENIPRGYYRLKVDIPDDVFIKKIVTFQQLVMFKGNVYLVDNPEYVDILGDKNTSSTVLYTDSSSLSFYTAHDDGYQEVRAGSQYVTIDKTHTSYDVTVAHDPDQLISILSPRNDLYVSGDGFFTFSPDNYFDVHTDIAIPLDQVDSLDDYQYVIASYPQADTVGSWKVASASVSVPKLYFEKQGYNYVSHFIISLPGLSENNRRLNIQKVTVRFEKDPITWSNIIPRLKNIFSR